jgi:type IV pilus assembly protein PilE
MSDMKQSGFTLVELMFTVLIIGILAGVAYPSYVDSVRRAKRSDAMNAMLSLQLSQQKVRANCRFYAGTLATADACGGSADSTKVAASATSGEGLYTLAVTEAGTQGYVITATPVSTGSQANDTDCIAMTLTVNAANPDGLRAPATCW